MSVSIPIATKGRKTRPTSGQMHIVNERWTSSVKAHTKMIPGHGERASSGAGTDSPSILIGAACVRPASLQRGELARYEMV